MDVFIVKHLMIYLFCRQTAIDGGNLQGSGTVNFPEQLASRLFCFGVDMGMYTATLTVFIFSFTITKSLSIV